jgi:hypothetical protein
MGRGVMNIFSFKLDLNYSFNEDDIPKGNVDKRTLREPSISLHNILSVKEDWVYLDGAKFLHIHTGYYFIYGGVYYRVGFTPTEDERRYLFKELVDVRRYCQEEFRKKCELERSLKDNKKRATISKLIGKWSS